MTREDRVLEDLMFHVRATEIIDGALTERGRVMMEAYYVISAFLLERDMRHRDLGRC